MKHKWSAVLFARYDCSWSKDNGNSPSTYCVLSLGIVIQNLLFFTFHFVLICSLISSVLIKWVWCVNIKLCSKGNILLKIQIPFVWAFFVELSRSNYKEVLFAYGLICTTFLQYSMTLRNSQSTQGLVKLKTLDWICIMVNEVQKNNQINRKEKKTKGSILRNWWYWRWWCHLSKGRSEDVYMSVALTHRALRINFTPLYNRFWYWNTYKKR